MKKFTVFLLTLAMLLSMASSLVAAEDIKWTETDMPDGWTKVTNEGGVTLGYSKSSGLGLVYADGFAFKDLNKNGQLDVFEDWRVDFSTRAHNLVETEKFPVEWQMGIKMNPFGVGTASATELSEATMAYLDAGYRHIRFANTATETVVGWNNLLNAYTESLDMVAVPTTFIADPLNGGSTVSHWPGYLAMAATFDPNIAHQQGFYRSQEWRALGLSMKVAPQIDLATEPRWSRIDMTFGEDPQLSMDMSVAIVNAWQSTYDEDGNDLGWGIHSVNPQIKHLPGDGAAEGGRESHTLDGAYSVFPGGQYWTQFMPFLATLKLPGLTKTVSAAMTNFSIALDADGNTIGGAERVSTIYNSWIIDEVLRGYYGWDGYILSDFGIIRDGAKHYGVETLTEPERFLKFMESGHDGIGLEGSDIERSMEMAMEAYRLGVEKHGQEEMDDILLQSTRRSLNTLFNVGLFDNPYLSLATAQEVVKNKEAVQAGYEATLKSIVMVKNSDNLIKEASGEKQTVYIPYKYFPAVAGRGGVTPAYVAPSMNLDEARKYFNVVTDEVGEPTGKDDDGKEVFTADDIIRATADELKNVDFALVRISSPQDGNPKSTAFSNLTADGGAGYDDTMRTVPEDFEYLPISLQYRPYRATSSNVRFESIGGQVYEVEVEGVYGMEIETVKENRSYYGKTANIKNESDLDYVLYAASVVDKVVVCIDNLGAMIFSEFENEVDSILLSFSGGRIPNIEDKYFFEIASGNVEPSALLPMQQPKDMITVEAQYEDVPRDMAVHVDSDGNAYDFTFGMNWSGVINDERVEKYNVAPLVGINPFE